MTSSVTVFGFGGIDHCNLNTQSAQHKKKLGLQGFKHATVLIIRVPCDTLEKHDGEWVSIEWLGFMHHWRPLRDCDISTSSTSTTRLFL